MEINEASGDDRPDPDIAEQAVPAARLPVGRVIREGYQLVGSHFVSAAMLTVVIGFLFYSLRTYLSDHASISGSILRTLALDIAFNTVVAVVLALVTTRWLRQFILGERERLRLPGLRELRGMVAVLVVLLAIDGSLPLEMRLAATVAPWLKPLAGLPWILLILVFDLFRISVLAVLLMPIVPAISVDAPRPVARVFAAASRDFGRLVGVFVIGLARSSRQSIWFPFLWHRSTCRVAMKSPRRSLTCNAYSSWRTSCTLACSCAASLWPRRPIARSTKPRRGGAPRSSTDRAVAVCGDGCDDPVIVGTRLTLVS
jgi:hypothetical protein